MNDLQFTIIYGSLIVMLLITVYCLICVPRKRTTHRKSIPLHQFYKNMRNKHSPEIEEDLEEEY